MDLYQKQLFGTDGFVILTEGKVPGHLTRLDDKGAFPRGYAHLFTAAPDLLEALECAPIVAAGESLAEFRSRQDAWLNGKYRAAISRALPGGEGK